MQPPGTSISARFSTTGPGQHQMLIDSISLLLAVRQSSSCTLVFMPTDGLFHASLAVQRNFFDAGGAGMQSE